MKIILLCVFMIVLFLSMFSIEYPNSFVPSAFQYLQQSENIGKDSLIVAELIWLNGWYTISTNLTMYGMGGNFSSYDSFSIQSINEHTRFMDKSIEFGMNITLWPEYVGFQNQTHLCTQGVCNERGNTIEFLKVTAPLMGFIVLLIAMYISDQHRASAQESMGASALELNYLFPDHEFVV